MQIVEKQFEEAFCPRLMRQPEALALSDKEPMINMRCGVQDIFGAPRKPNERR